MDELRLRANGLGFRCLSAGREEAPLVLLLHGWPEGAESWTPQLEALAAAGLRAVAPDLRGFGGTDCPEGEEAYRLPHLLADVEGLIDALGVERCHLVGHDWGALVGWSFTSRRPQRLQTWSALSVGHPEAFAEAALRDEDQQRRSSYIRLLRTVGKAEEVLAAEGYRRLRAMYRSGPNPDAIPARVVEHYVASFSRAGRLTASLNYYRANLSAHAREEFPPAPERIQVPSQLVWGDADPAVGRLGVEMTGDYMAEEYRLTVLEGAGHWLQFERAEEVSRLLVDWTRSH
jgi:pimeloyl-ACP methyl ester carboxylesterase